MSLAFGNEVVSTTSAVKSVTVTNNQTVTLNISSIAVPASYAQTNNCGSSLAVGAGCTINVTFTPTSTGSKPGTLTITDSANTSPQSIGLSGGGVAAPIISSLSPNSGSVGASVTISGSNLGMQANGSVAFNGIVASPTSWTATAIAAPVPAGATTGDVVVTVYGGSSNGVTFTVGPSISGVSPTSAPIGSSVTITGTNFGATQGSSTVSFNGTSATPTSWGTTSIVVPVPSGATTGNVVVTVNGTPSSGVSFTVTPFIQSLSPTSGPVGASVTISGTSFGATEGSSTVKFNGTSATPTSWSDTSIVLPVPNGANTGNVIATVNGNASNGVNFTVTSVLPSLQSIAIGPPNASLSAGTAQPFTATGAYTDGSSQDLTIDVTWSTSNPTIASIDATGVSTGLTTGDVTIQASLGSVIGSAALSVTHGQLNAIVTPAYTLVSGSQAFPNQKAIAVGADGFTRFLAGDATSVGSNDVVVYVRCLDQDCVTSHSATFNAGSSNFIDAYSLALGPDGFARIAYSAGSALSFIQCSDNDCSSSTNTFVDFTSDNGVVSVAVASDGTSYIVYDDGNDVSGPQGVGMATCVVGSCSVTHIADVSIFDAIGGVITMGADGNPVIVYEDSGNSNQGVPDSVHYYQNGVNTVFSSNGNGSIYNMDVAIAPDGFGRIAYITAQGNAELIQCTNASCAANTSGVISFSGQKAEAVSLAIGPEGNPIIEGGSGTSTPSFIDYVTCSTANCSSYIDRAVVGTFASTGKISLALDPDLYTGRFIAQTASGTIGHIRLLPPDHLVVQSDITKVVCTSSSNTVRRRITYAEVDVNDKNVGTISTKEQFGSIGTNTCNKDITTTQTCSPDQGGILTDQLFVGCNSVGGSCGLTLTHQQWLWCPASNASPIVIATPGDIVAHNDSVTVSGCAKFPKGTKIFASGSVVFPPGTTCGSN